MSALDDLLAGERALIAALDADDVAAIERASAEVAAVLPHLTAVDDASRDQAEEALSLARTARAMLNLLSDRTEGKLGRLAGAVGAGPATYGRNARMRR